MLWKVLCCVGWLWGTLDRPLHTPQTQKQMLVSKRLIGGWSLSGGLKPWVPRGDQGPVNQVNVAVELSRAFAFCSSCAGRTMELPRWWNKPAWLFSGPGLEGWADWPGPRPTEKSLAWITGWRVTHLTGCIISSRSNIFKLQVSIWDQKPAGLHSPHPRNLKPNGHYYCLYCFRTYDLTYGEKYFGLTFTDHIYMIFPL